MIIKEIHIDGFGIFNDFSLTSLDKGINILLGNNEVGKSTLLAFIRYTLFGYPDPRSKSNQYPALKGGQHGGRIKAILGSNMESTFERYAGSKGGQIRLLYHGQETRNPGQWYQLLGNASAELYKNVYAFSLEELVDLGSLSESGVEDKIFSVGMGMGNISIGEVESNIRTKIDELYTPKGKIQKTPQILQEIESKKSRFKRIQENLPQYESLTRDIKQLEKEVKELDFQIKELRNEESQLHNLLRCYTYFITITSSDQELEALPQLQDYPEGGMKQLEKLEKNEQDLNDRIRELKNGSQDEPGIEELTEAIGKISYNAELVENEDRVEYLRKNLEKYKQAISDKEEDEQKIRGYEDSINQGIASISGKWTERDITGFTDLTVHTNRIEGFKKEFEHITEDKRNLDAQIKASQLKESPLNAKGIALIFSIVFFIGSVPAFYYGLHVLGGSLVLIALLLLFGRKFFVKEGSYIHLETSMDDLKNKERGIQEEYRRYLEQQLNLPGSLPADATLEVFKQVGQLKNQIRERDRLKEKMKQQRDPFIRKFEEAASAMKDLSEKTRRQENTEIMVNQIIYEFDHAREQLQNKNRLEKDLARKQTALKNAESELKQVQSGIGNLLESVQAADRQDFRKKYEENEKVKDTIRQKNEAVRAIENISGRGKAAEVIEYLKNNEKEHIESRNRELPGEIDSTDQEWKDKNNELGEKRSEIKRIEGESELAAVLTELETEKQKLQDVYQEWITGKIALNILHEVKSRYEQEKQPKVIRNSSRYFKKITMDNYEKVRVSLDEKEVAVYDSTGGSKKINQLSRGTKEQLLISLRLGFIEEYEKQSEPLPLIVDEVMVNFDPYRARQITGIFREFAENRQILMFTCHPFTMEHFDSSSINTIKIE